MGWGKMFFTVVITFSAALITYNILISANASFKQEFPGPSSAKSLFSQDPIIKMPSNNNIINKKKRLFHTAVTSSDSVYNTWQCRIMYYWFKKFKDEPNSEMGGFTRILHSGKSDRFMDEIPTFVAQPLPSGMDQGYIVLNRPWAFVQWLQQAQIEEDYILMSEPDHVIVKPIPNLSKDGLGAAFPFFYIEPKKYESVLRKFFPQQNGPITDIDPVGNSPVIVSKEALKKIAPTWMNVSLAMKKDPEADKAFGWVLEMYAYAVASALHNVGNVLHKEFMIQPPWDTEIGKAFIIHYTYGCDYDMKGKMTYGKIGEWRFDKRSYDNTWPPKNLSRHSSGHYRFELRRHDVTEPLLVEVDKIYHLACPASPIFYKYNAVKTIKTNVIGTLNMLGLAKRVGARILLTSTSEVYGDPLVHPQPESYWGNVNPIGVRSCYDEGKRVAETLMFDYHRQHGIEIRIARIFNTYGPRMNIDDGRVVSNFIAQSLRDEPLTVQAPGTQTRSFCYVSDMVDGLIRLMEGDNTGPINIGNPGEFTMIELAELVKELISPKVEIKMVENTPDDPRQRKPDITKAKELLGWEPKVKLRDGLPLMEEDFRLRLGVSKKI